MWFLVDKENFTVNRRFVVVGTGRDLPTEELTYIDTIQILGENLIGHIWEVDFRTVEQSDDVKKLISRNNVGC